MAFRVGQANFTRGEFAPELSARADVATYQAGAARLRNVVIKKYGGVEKRPGTRIVAEVWDQTNPVRLVPFQFSIEQTYAIEMGQGYARFAALGGVVIETKLAITAITNAVNAQVTAAFHGYSVGEQVYFDEHTGMADLQGRFAKVVSVIDQNNFTIDIDTRAMGAFTGDSGGTVNAAPPPAPPAPPVVPPVVPPPDPPPTGGGGHGGSIPPGGNIP